MVKVAVLNDNRCDNNSLECEHGLSLYVEYDNKKFLFDSGQTDIFLKNAKIMGIDLNNLDFIVLSHGDYDHGNGLKYLDFNTNLICHPDFLKTRISKRTGKFDGLNQSKEELKQKYNLIITKESYEISDKIIFLGEIERNNDFEKGDNLPMIDESGDTYQHKDDSGIVLKTDNGIVVISGCAHSGICNTIEYAKKVAKDNRVLAAIGGFHLKEINDQTNKTIDYIIENDIKYLYPAHCTSDSVCEEFTKRMSGKVKVLSTGMCLNIY